MRVQRLLKRTLGFFLLLAAMTPGASAGLITYIGTDVGASEGDPTPISDHAAATFDAANGPEIVITFESTCPLPSFLPCAQFGELPTTKLMVAPGVFINGLNDNTPNAGRQQIGAPGITGSSPLEGYNTTPGGSRELVLSGGFLTFTFDTPIDRFGAYIAGANLDGDTITFNDGSQQMINIPNAGGPGPNLVGGLSFVGFTDFGQSIQTVTFNVGFDRLAIDDVRAPVAAPEPSLHLLLLAVLAAIVMPHLAGVQPCRN
jgi:hypothetical protein